MRVFDKIDPLTIDHRDWQLHLLALSMIFVLGAGVALLMYPAVLASPVVPSGLALRKIFFAFCALCLLLISYLIERQLVIRRLRRQLIEEERQITRLRLQASADLLDTLPGLGHFQDRLTMEFRRAANTQAPLSVLMVGLKAARGLSTAEDISAAFGDGAKSLIRKLRGEDSIYYFRSGVFGILLPDVQGSDANRVAGRLAEGLIDSSGANSRFSFAVRLINYPEHTASAHEMGKMAVSCFPRRVSGAERSRRVARSARNPSGA